MKTKIEELIREVRERIDEAEIYVMNIHKDGEDAVYTALNKAMTAIDGIEAYLRTSK